MIPMRYSEAWGTLIYEKNLKSKISCQTPFKVLQKCHNAKSVFLAVSASFHWLNNVSGMFYVVKVSFLLIGQQG